MWFICLTTVRLPYSCKDLKIRQSFWSLNLHQGKRLRTGYPRAYTCALSCKYTLEMQLAIPVPKARMLCPHIFGHLQTWNGLWKQTFSIFSAFYWIMFEENREILWDFLNAFLWSFVKSQVQNRLTLNRPEVIDFSWYFTETDDKSGVPTTLKRISNPMFSIMLISKSTFKHTDCVQPNLYAQ